MLNVESSPAIEPTRPTPATIAPLRAPAVSARPSATAAPTRISVKDVNAFYGSKQALFDVSLEVPDNAVTAFIGASGCGKSTLLRCLNRMNDTIPGARVDGDIRMDGIDINSPAVDPVQVRTRIGMVFQKPSPFPMSIYDNVAIAPACTSSQRPRPTLMPSSRNRCAARRYGTKSKTDSNLPV